MLNILKEDDKELTIKLTEKYRTAVDEMIEKWHFKDAMAAIEFALAVISSTKPGKVWFEKPNGKVSVLLPIDELVDPEYKEKNYA